MKRHILYFYLLCSITLSSQEVSESLAIKMAHAYHQTLDVRRTNQSATNTIEAALKNDTRVAERISPLGKASMWLVPVDDGWILLSGSTKATPILGHIQSFEKPIYDSLPDAAKELYNTFEDYLFYINEHNREYPMDKRWQSVIEEESLSSQFPREMSVDIGPLLNVRWGQAYGGSCGTNKIYNKFCPPVDNSDICNKAYVGCVAVAIAQIMWYWKWPYAALVPTTVGGSTGELKFYDWDMMPPSINNSTDMEQVDMVAGFLRDCGYKLDMNYGPGGSMAADANAKNTLVAFGYDENTINLRSKWNTPGWTNMLRSNIDSGQPVYYSGWSKTIGGKGHAFVVDGYRTGNYPIYHINFGWRGIYDGWYNIDEAHINDSTHYEHSQKAIFGIRPATACVNLTLSNSLFFSSKFCYAIGGDLTIANATLTNITKGELYSSTQVKLTTGVNIAHGSSVHIAIKPVPCQTQASNSSTMQSVYAERHSINAEQSHRLQDISVSPNPAFDIVTINCQVPIKRVLLFNTNGQVVLQQARTRIDISHLPIGIYIVRAVTQNGDVLQTKIIHN